MVKKLSYSKCILNIFALLIIGGLFYSCGKKNATGPTLVFNDTIREVIVAYMDSFPQFNTFFLKESESIYSITENLPHGFLLGPGYDYLTEKKGFMRNSDLSLFWEIDSRRVYYISDFSRLFKYDTISQWKNRHVVDSVILGKNYPLVIKDPDMLYVMRSIFFYFDRDKLVVNYRPDTLFIPEYSDVGHNWKDMVP